MKLNNRTMKNIFALSATFIFSTIYINANAGCLSKSEDTASAAKISCTKSNACSFTMEAPVATTVLTDFSGTYSNQRVILAWSTAQEVNIDTFVVEKSSDGKNWQTLSTVAPAGNNTTNVYYTADVKPLAVTWYRLKQVDVNATAVYSDVLKVAGKKRKV